MADKLYAIEAVIYVALTPAQEPEHIAARVDHGLMSAVAPFPDADVLKASVKLIRPVKDAEANEEGLTE